MFLVEFAMVRVESIGGGSVDGVHDGRQHDDDDWDVSRAARFVYVSVYVMTLFDLHVSIFAVFAKDGKREGGAKIKSRSTWHVPLHRPRRRRAKITRVHSITTYVRACTRASALY